MKERKNSLKPRKLQSFSTPKSAGLFGRMATMRNINVLKNNDDLSNDSGHNSVPKKLQAMSPMVLRKSTVVHRTP
jgi:hypothetical protein